MTAPCKNCKDRYLGCHSECEKYIAYKDDRQAMHKRKEKAGLIDGYQKEEKIRCVRDGGHITSEMVLLFFIWRHFLIEKRL